MNDGREFVTGREMAAAREADERRFTADDPVPSPLPPGRYDHELGEYGLYRIAPLPYDEALAAFARDYRAMSDNHRAGIRDAVGLDDGYTLLNFARRSAVFALRSQVFASVVDGLGACAAIGYERIDQRDALRALACLHHAAERCGADPVMLFKEGATSGEAVFGRLVAGFLGRPPAERDLRDAWGLVEVEGPQGLGLLEWGFAPWMPTTDLVGTSLRISAALRGDDYEIDDPTLAVELPAVWLSEARDPALEPMLGAARGAALIHGRLRQDVTPEYASQRLSAWLVEVSDELAAERLVELSLTPRPGNALLGLAAGPLFVLVVARSVVHGTPSFEAGGSLERFAASIGAALSG